MVVQHPFPSSPNAYIILAHNQLRSDAISCINVCQWCDSKKSNFSFNNQQTNKQTTNLRNETKNCFLLVQLIGFRFDISHWKVIRASFCANCFVLLKLIICIGTAHPMMLKRLVFKINIYEMVNRIQCTEKKTK